MIEHPGHGPRRQVGGLSQRPRRHGPAGPEDVEAPPLGPVQPGELGGHGVDISWSACQPRTSRVSSPSAAARVGRHEARYRTSVRCTIRGNRVETPCTPHRLQVDHPTRGRGQQPAERGQPADVRGNAKPPHLATRYPTQPLHLVVLGLTRPRSKRIVLQVARSPETLQTRSRRPNPPAPSGPQDLSTTQTMERLR